MIQRELRYKEILRIILKTCAIAGVKGFEPPLPAQFIIAESYFRIIYGYMLK